MAKKIRNKLSAFTGHLAWEYLAGAVLLTYRRNAFGVVFGHPPDSVLWVIDEQLRSDLLKNVSLEWCYLSGKDFTYFPYSISAVVRMYERIRCQSPTTRKEWEAELAALCPAFARALQLPQQ